MTFSGLICKENSGFWHSLLWGLEIDGLKRSVLYVCNNCFLKTINYVVVQKFLLDINGLTDERWTKWYHYLWIQASFFFYSQAIVLHQILILHQRTAVKTIAKMIYKTVAPARVCPSSSPPKIYRLEKYPVPAYFFPPKIPRWKYLACLKKNFYLSWPCRDLGSIAQKVSAEKPSKVFFSDVMIWLVSLLKVQGGRGGVGRFDLKKFCLIFAPGVSFILFCMELLSVHYNLDSSWHKVICLLFYCVWCFILFIPRC